MDRLINISFLSSFTQSSSSIEWEKFKIGNPTDGWDNTNRYSIHTDKEIDPYVIFHLPKSIYVQLVELTPRIKYFKNSLPIKITGMIDGEEFLIKEINNPTDNCTAIVNRKISKVKITSIGHKSIDFSSFAIFVTRAELSKISDSFDEQSDGLIFAYSDFYGLGGKLSIIATACGYAGDQANQKYVICDPSLRTTLSYPPPYQKEKNKNVEAFLKNWAPTNIKQFLDEKKYTGGKNIAMYTPNKLGANENRRFTFVSRNKLDNFKIESESENETKRRLYQRMSPSISVLNKLEKLKERLNIDQGNTIGVHFRHGNGEQYFRSFEQYNRWGVKPPSIDQFTQELANILAAEKRIKSVLLCSDCLAVHDLLKNRFGGSHRIIFGSENIQDVGRGCNHTPKIFDHRHKRKIIDRESEDVDAFAEILLLAGCNYIYGGNSFFFDAVIGFSNNPDDRIYTMKSKDRYINLPKNMIPIGNIENGSILKAFDDKQIMIDGVFIDQDPTNISLFYFNEPLSSFEWGFPPPEKNISEIKSKLLKMRGY
jgi:hypothetical protein